jgi:hypothetical protein
MWMKSWIRRSLADRTKRGSPPVSPQELEEQTREIYSSLLAKYAAFFNQWDQGAWQFV